MLEPVDKVEILSLVDNCLDHLSSERKEVRSARSWRKQADGKVEERLPLAEHGFSVLVRVSKGNQKHCVLFDTGPSPEAIVTNAKRLGVDMGEVEVIVLSHGHWDHAGGLLSAIKAVNKPDLPVIVHEDMFRTRGMALPSGAIRRHHAFPSAEQIKPAMYVVTQKPSLLAGNSVLVTGEIPHQTNFEKGLTWSRYLANGEWVPEPWLQDDRALVMNLKGKGLVVLTGCGHAGIINTLLHVKELTGVDEVYAVMGGFHLAGKAQEVAIPETVENLKSIAPKLIAPSHCTGWRGMFAIYQAMPEAFVWNTVGNLYVFE